LDARTELVEPRTTGYEPGRPILVMMHIRNRLGVARESPSELVRPGPDGKPALRKGSPYRSGVRLPDAPVKITPTM
jgi:hypothetical protein